MGIIGAPVAAAMANGPEGNSTWPPKNSFLKTLGAEHPVSVHAYDFTLSQCLMHTHDKSHAFAADWYYVDPPLDKGFFEPRLLFLFFPRRPMVKLMGRLCGRKAGSRLFPNYRGGRLKNNAFAFTHGAVIASSLIVLNEKEILFLSRTCSGQASLYQT